MGRVTVALQSLGSFLYKFVRSTSTADPFKQFLCIYLTVVRTFCTSFVVPHERRRRPITRSDTQVILVQDETEGHR